MSKITRKHVAPTSFEAAIMADLAAGRRVAEAAQSLGMAERRKAETRTKLDGIIKAIAFGPDRPERDQCRRLYFHHPDCADGRNYPAEWPA